MKDATIKLGALITIGVVASIVAVAGVINLTWHLIVPGVIILIFAIIFFNQKEY